MRRQAHLAEALGGAAMLDGLFEPTHLIFILAIVLIIFGPGKLPEFGKGLGKGIREFKDAIRTVIPGDSDKPAEQKKM
jgi:sec-independent protein translocase protein TatA